MGPRACAAARVASPPQISGRGRNQIRVTSRVSRENVEFLSPINAVRRTGDPHNDTGARQDGLSVSRTSLNRSLMRKERSSSPTGCPG